MPRHLLLATALALTATFQPKPAEARHHKRARTADIVTTAARADEFSTLIRAVGAAELEGALRGKGPITVFAPTDKAFAKLPRGTLEALLQPENRDQLRRLLTYHVVPGHLDAEDVLRRSGAETLAGPRLAFSPTKRGVKIDGATVIAADIRAKNGIIHAIDEVLIPPELDLVSTAKKTGTFDTLLSAATAAGLADELRDDGPYTVFAPTDEAFAKLGRRTVKTLLKPENAYVSHVHDYWGTPASRSAFKLELRAEGAEGIRGRALNGASWAGAEGAVLHELNHLVTQSMDGTSAPSLSEGVATALAPSDPAGMWGPGSGAPESFAFVPYSELDFSVYQPSAQLVRFLIQRYGIQTVREAYIVADADDTAEEIEAAYVSVFGDEIYDAFDEFEAGPQCGLRAWECEPSLHPMLELPVDITSPEDCTKDTEWAGAAGDLNEHWYPHRRFLLQVDEETQIVAYADNPRVARSTCGDVCPSYLDTPPGFENVAATSASGAVFPRTLVAGLHTFHVLPLDPSLPFSVRIERAE